MEEQQAIFSSLYYCILPLLFFIFFTRWLYSAITSQKNSPPVPSPSKLPVVGNLFQLGRYPHRSLQSMAQRLGPVMLLHLGNAPTLVISSADAAREIMTTHDIVFSNRPDSSIARKLLYDHKDLSQALYGEYWRQMRSICVLQLLNERRVRSFRSIREEETALLAEKIDKFCTSSLPIDLTEMFALLTNDVICRTAFGRKYSEGDSGRKFMELLQEFGELLGVFSIGDYIPWLGWIDYLTGLNSRVDRVFNEFDRFLDEVVDSASKKVGAEEDKQTFVDILLEIQRNSEDDSSILRDSIKAIILDMFAAGTDTTATTLEWTMTEMLRRPEVMEKAQHEVRLIVGSKPKVTEDDLEKMPYLKAVIKESLRWHPALPLLVPRQSSKDVKLQGYHIQAKTRVLINAWAIGRDPMSWEEPDRFRPERFLHSTVDFKGLDFQYIPFGAGRRGCPGITFATAVLGIALATLLHKFDWSLPGESRGEDLDVTESPGLAVHRKYPLVAIAAPVA